MTEVLTDEYLAAIERDLQDFGGPAYLTSLIAEVRAARARQEGWRPISEAPRDGTPVLLLTNEPVEAGQPGPIYLAVWENNSDRAEQPFYEWCVPGSWQDEQGGYYTVDSPTHWQPLPAAPKVTI